MKKRAVIELHYLPSIPYMATWTYFDELILESKESYSKQSFRNRCRINTAHKVDDLIVPIQKGNSNVPIQEVRIDYKQAWFKNHWGAIQSAYGKAPFFEHYADDIHRILYNNHKFLFDLNLEILEYLLTIQGIHKKIIFTQKYEKEYPDSVVDLRSVIHPKEDPGKLSYYDSPSYVQVFGDQFVRDLSFVDLLFCEGPDALKILKRSVGFL